MTPLVFVVKLEECDDAVKANLSVERYCLCWLSPGSVKTSERVKVCVRERRRSGSELERERETQGTCFGSENQTEKNELLASVFFFFFWNRTHGLRPALRGFCELSISSSNRQAQERARGEKERGEGEKGGGRESGREGEREQKQEQIVTMWSFGQCYYNGYLWFESNPPNKSSFGQFS